MDTFFFINAIFAECTFSIENFSIDLESVKMKCMRDENSNDGFHIAYATYFNFPFHRLRECGAHRFLFIIICDYGLSLFISFTSPFAVHMLKNDYSTFRFANGELSESASAGVINQMDDHICETRVGLSNTGYPNIKYISQYVEPSIQHEMRI